MAAADGTWAGLVESSGGGDVTPAHGSYWNFFSLLIDAVPQRRWLNNDVLIDLMEPFV